MPIAPHVPSSPPPSERTRNRPSAVTPTHRSGRGLDRRKRGSACPASRERHDRDPGRECAHDRGPTAASVGSLLRGAPCVPWSGRRGFPAHFPPSFGQFALATGWQMWHEVSRPNGAWRTVCGWPRFSGVHGRLAPGRWQPSSGRGPDDLAICRSVLFPLIPRRRRPANRAFGRNFAALRAS
jgi:hypothetical protein